MFQKRGLVIRVPNQKKKASVELLLDRYRKRENELSNHEDASREEMSYKKGKKKKKKRG